MTPAAVRRGALGLALLAASGAPGAAQPSTRTPPTLPPAALRPDSVAGRPAGPRALGVTPRPVPDSALAALRAEDAFRYDRPVAERPSLWDRFKAWVVRTILAPIWEGSQSPGGRVFSLLVGAGVLVWAALRLLGVEGGGPFGRRGARAATSGDLLDVDDLGAVDLRAHLRQAEAAGDGRAALRLRFLLALQTLDARGLVAWSKEKTNRDYVREAQDAAGDDLAAPLADVTRAFEAVWYGGRPDGIDRYRQLAPVFERLDAALGARP